MKEEAENQVYVVSLGMGKDLSRSIVDAWNWAAVVNFLGRTAFFIGIEGCNCPFRSCVGGEQSIVEGVWGKDEDGDEIEESEDEGLEGSNAGTSGWWRLEECDLGEWWCV